MADSSIFIEKHVLLHTSLSRVDQLILHSVYCLHQAIFEQVLQHGRINILLCSSEILKVDPSLVCGSSNSHWQLCT